MGNFDQYVAIGKEATYGTAVDPTRWYEAMADGFRRTIARVESGGIRAGRHGKLAKRSRTVTKGAEGAVEAAMLTKGFGLLLEGAIGSAAITTPTGATLSRLMTFATDEDPPDESYTFEVARAQADTGAIQRFRTRGCVVRGWSIGCSVDEKLMLTLNYDAVTEATSTTATTIPADAYPDGEQFIWEDFAVTLGGVALSQLRGFSFDFDLGLGLDTSFLKGSATKDKPLRVTDPVGTGTLDARFTGTGQYDDFVSGDVVELVAEATFPEVIETGHNPFVRLTLPAIKFTGDTPVSSPDDYTTQGLPFEVYWDESDALATLEYQTSDTAF